ncbi:MULTISPECIES: ABC transporter transmembrane domain-containing protein [unclassified Novosphingobium]|uniref:ABC transporter transmembrane domain-containing protein n=1 Tax=unclassified Novosphingobium TaxID=2644732 RepID=UPI0025F2920E|nr:MULTISPECIES: ABC transporter transmembrane domain-containing protein [unclassified Novosphingobium]HQV04301.1 ABC transporter transmembrane domain-containing protein [Novosphingobium sp.]
MSSDPQVAQATPATETAATEPPPARNLGPLRMVARETAKYPRHMIMALLALTVTASATLAIPAGFRMVVDRGFGEGGDIESIARWFRYLLLIVVVLGLGTAVRFYFVSWLGERVIADIRLKVQTNLMRLSPGFFEENSPNEISSRMTSDTALIEQVVGTTVSVALRNFITGIGGVVILFSLAPKLTAGLLAGLVVVMTPLLMFGRRIRTISRSSQDRVADIGAMVAEVLGAMKVVQAFNQEDREARRFADSVELSFATAKRRIVLRAVISALAIVAIFGAIVLLVWQGAIGVAEGTITSGTIVQIVFVAVIVAGSFGALTEVYGDLLRGAGAASRLSELLNERPQIAAPERPLALPSPGRGKLSFEGVTFRYPTRPEHAALLDFSLTVEPGETVAIVGPSGAGKSTLFQLAERFYDPQTGTIKMDGVPITAVDPAEVRRRIALVPQEAILFAANARDNLRYGNWEADDEAIWEAARAANAETFLRDLPDGLDTYLGEGGARLSGGQRQRVAIARAVLRKAPILLLDEATSALDAESELLVQQALDRLIADRTTLVIAHRLATVRGADRIVVLDQGRIVETGTHDQLARAGGLYARLASLQFDERAYAAQKEAD